MSSQYQCLQTIMNRFMETAQQSLVHVITSLESDQLLEQMRNDQNLYHQKMNYIKELIKHNFLVVPINELLVKQVQNLKQTQSQLEQKFQSSRQEYILELNNIQVQYKEFLAQKENQKRLMENAIEQKNHNLFILDKDFTIKAKKLQTECQNLQQELEKAQQTHCKTKSQLQESIRQKQKLKRQLNQLRQLEKQFKEEKTAKQSQLSTNFTQLQQENSRLFQKIDQLQEKLTQKTHSQQTYLQTIQSMKEDMFLIKQEWQKRCEQVHRELTSDYRNKLIDHQKEMNSKLKLYMEELKMGRNIIIESTDEILQSKKQIMQDRFNSEINRCQQQIIELQNSLQQEKLKHNQTSVLLKQTNQKLRLAQTEHRQATQKLLAQLNAQQSTSKSKQQQYEHRISSLRHQTDKQIQRLRKTQNMLLKDLKASKHQKQQILKQVHSIRDQFNNYKQKQTKQTHKLKELQLQNQKNTTKILQLKKDLAIMNQKSIIDQKSLKQKNQQIHRLQNNLNQTKHDCKDLDTVARRLQLKISQLNLKNKQHQKIKAQNNHKLQKLYLVVRKLSKQLAILKQDIAFHIDVQKTKIQTLILSISEEMTSREQVLKMSQKQRIRELLDEFQEERKHQKVELDQVLRENQNMKKQIKLLQQIMQQKQQDYLYNRERIINLQVEKCRLIMQEEINKQREHSKKLQEKIYQQQKSYEQLITKSQKQISKQLGLFIAKWQHKISQSNQLFMDKQKTLKQMTFQLRKITSEYQSVSQQLRQKQQKLTKHQRKYSSLKQQRDKTVEEMMKRLEKQTKHKLALERQLNEIRGQIIKTQANTNSSSPFNNYSFTDRENTNIYTNAFQTATQDKMKTHVKHTNRQKELSEIREMIAKTYKVVQNRAEIDSPLLKGKLF